MKSALFAARNLPKKNRDIAAAAPPFLASSAAAPEDLPVENFRRLWEIHGADTRLRTGDSHSDLPKCGFHVVPSSRFLSSETTLLGGFDLVNIQDGWILGKIRLEILDSVATIPCDIPSITKPTESLSGTSSRRLAKAASSVCRPCRQAGVVVSNNF
jgi:hypothetical protein